MKEINQENLHSFCRTCLAELEEKSSLMGEKYSIPDDNLLEELISLWCASMPVEDDTKFPNFVCRKCYEKLQSFHDFRCQTMQSICILNNIIKEFNKNINSEDDRLDSGQGSEEKLDCSELKVAEEICGSTKWDELCNEGAAGYRNPTRSQEKLQNCIENAVVKILHDPIEYAKEKRNELADEVEINLSDIKMEATADALDALEILETTRNALNPLPAEDGTQSLDMNVQTSSAQDVDSDTENEKSNDDSTDNSVRSAKKSKSRKSVRVNIKKSTKSTKSLPAKKGAAGSKSQSVIGGGAKFKCDQCPRRCLTWENYEAHLRTHQGLKPFVCQECGRSFNKADRCRQHAREAHAPVALQYICSYEGCNKVFTRQGTYQTHYRLKHTAIVREPRQYVCEICGSTFKNSTKFKEHCYKHAPVEEYPFKCDECGKRFRAKKHFKEHLLRHSGIKKFICPYCGMKKPTQHELRTHINYHTRERQWSCTNCPSVFSTSANLGRHIRVVHKGIRQFVCTYCDESFGKKETLKHHEMRHTGEKPHGCEICGKRFIQVTAYRTHMKTHNKSSTARTQSKMPLNDKVATFVERTVNSEADSIEPSIQSDNETNASNCRYINITTT